MRDDEKIGKIILYIVVKIKKIGITEHLHFSIVFIISDSDSHSQPTKYRQLILSGKIFF